MADERRGLLGAILRDHFDEVFADRQRRQRDIDVAEARESRAVTGSTDISAPSRLSIRALITGVPPAL